MEKSRAIELLEHLSWDRDIERNPYGDALNMAIEALKAQLSCEGATSDLISRQAAIDAINSWRGRFSEEYNEAIDDCENSIKELPIIQPEPQWIPVSERLPAAKSEYYWREFKTRPLTEEEKEFHPDIVLILDCDLPKNGQKILITVNEPGHEPVQTDVFCDDGECSLDSLYEIGTEATAWMPLPEPYKPNKKQSGKEGA